MIVLRYRGIMPGSIVDEAQVWVSKNIPGDADLVWQPFTNEHGEIVYPPAGEDDWGGEWVFTCENSEDAFLFQLVWGTQLVGERVNEDDYK